MKKIALACALALISYNTLAQAQKTENCVDVVVFSLNDFHGAFVQNPYQNIPGAPSILQTLDSLKTVYPYNLTVSAGDNFGGSYFYTATKGQLMPVFFNMAGIRLSAMGNHEFDDGLPTLEKKWKDSPIHPAGWDITYLCSNVYDSQGAQPAVMQPFAVSSVRISPTKEARIALVSLLASSAKEQISSSKTKGISFSGEYTHVLDSVSKLPTFKEVENAEIRALLLHIGAYMADGVPAWNDKRSDELSKINTPFYQAFLVGHSHDAVVGHINESKKPITQGFWHGNYINMMKFSLDTVRMEVVNVTPAIIPVRPRQRTELSGNALRLQEQIDSLMECTLTKAGSPLNEYVAHANRSIAHDRTNKYVISEVGTLVCNGYATAYRRASKCKDSKMVIGISHFGSIRSGLTKGDLSVMDVGEILPFQNDMHAYKFTGKELLRLLEFGYHNTRYGWLQYSNLEVERNEEGKVTSATYIAPNGTRKLIKPNSRLVLVLDSFMAGGGDGYEGFFFPKRRIKVALPSATDCFIKYLQEKKTI